MSRSLPLTPLSALLAAALGLVPCLGATGPASAQDSAGNTAGNSVAAHPDFGLEELKAMVAELEPFVAQNPNLAYPIDISIDESDVVNASAGFELRGDKRQAILVFCRGMIDATGRDPRLLRAVAAHELAHLALNHSLENFFNMRDLDNAWTRAEEHAADVMAAEVLVKAGYAVQDVVDMLLFLDRNANEKPRGWFGTVASTHASPITRAALLETPDSPRFRAVARFELGLAYMECRRYREALVYFDEALALEPRLSEAALNAASAALQYYYESLPDEVLAEWLRPDFGVHLTSTSLVDAKGLALTDDDRRRYDAAIARLDAIEGNPFPAYARFLRGTAQVLHPDGDEGELFEGVKNLRMLLGTPLLRVHQMGTDRVRWANNAAVGLHRLGKEKEALELLVAEQAKDMRYVAPAAANLARLPFLSLDRSKALTVVNVLAYHLSNSSPKTAGRAACEAVLTQATKELNVTLNSEPKARPVFLCAAARMEVGEHDLGLFDPLQRFLDALGEPAGVAGVHEKYPQLAVRFWGEADVILLAEREGAMKVTSYRPGSAVVLQPVDRGNRDSFRVSVGMSSEDLDALLSPSGAQLQRVQVPILGRAMFQGEGGGIENWTYYPALNLGVLVVEGQVAGLSVTPVKI